MNRNMVERIEQKEIGGETETHYATGVREFGPSWVVYEPKYNRRLSLVFESYSDRDGNYLGEILYIRDKGEYPEVLLPVAKITETKTEKQVWSLGGKGKVRVWDPLKNCFTPLKEGESVSINKETKQSIMITLVDSETLEFKKSEPVKFEIVK